MSDLIGIIGGSGLYEMEGFKVKEERKVETPFGLPSDKIVIGELSGREVAFLPRHGRGHKFSPSNINYRANICALKMVGVKWIISLSAVGSLRKDIKPGELVMVDQFIDKTYLRKNTFFDDGVVVHIMYGHPICEHISGMLYDSAKKLKIKAHKGGTYVCMEGPQFSTRAESFLHREWGADLIGMTNATEAKLAREAEICFATVALSTDYDCWKEDDHVDVAAILATVKQNIENAKSLIKEAVSRFPAEDGCTCHRALEGAIMTDLSVVSDETRMRLEPIAGKYLSKGE